MSHYETLGVQETASQEDIKSAYRKLAMKLHPDRNPNDKVAEEQFKAISAAYSVIGDESKRQEYDFQRKNPFANQTGQHHWTGGFTSDGNGGQFDDLISQIFAQHGFRNQQRQPTRNKDIKLELTISLEDAYFGKKMPIQFTTPSGKKVEVIVTIPEGIDNGVKIRYQGQGENTNKSLPPGDLYIVVSIMPHQNFIRQDNILKTVINVDAISAIIGTKKRINCIDGSIVELVIQPGTQHDTKLRIVGKGMPSLQKKDNNVKGDLIVVVQIKIPNDLKNEDIIKLKEIQDSRGLDSIAI